MEKTFKAFRVAALLSAVSGASVVLISGATPAKAGEERLHSTSTKVYGLIPPGESNKSTTSSNSTRTASADTLSSTVTTKSPSKRGGNQGAAASNEPKIEDPPMPSYDGPNGGGNAMASNDTGTSPGFN